MKHDRQDPAAAGEDPADQPVVPADPTAYQAAAGILDAIIAAYSSRIAQAPESAAGLLAARDRIEAEKRNLKTTDHASIQRIVARYPALLERIRRGQSDGRTS
ncbi:hypothetical protein GCM10029978_067920 [Actinoallomurus acanthiterrae]